MTSTKSSSLFARAQFIRTLIIDLLPPMLLRFAQKMWRRMRGIGFYTFEGSYASLTDVPCGDDQYDDVELAHKIVDNRLENLESAGLTKKIIDTNGRLLLPLIVSQSCDEFLTVIDFGGGLGVGLVNILNHVANLDLSKLSYVIVETPAMCQAVREKIEPILEVKLGTSSFVKVAEEIPTSISGALIVNVAGTIQYIASYQEILSRLASISPKYFIVSETPMTNGSIYARQQFNMPNRRLASWVFNQDEFINEMKSRGYELTFIAGHDQPLTHKNSPGPSSMMSMVFCPRAQSCGLTNRP